MKRKGFTLVELVIVIAILGILAGVAIPAYANLQDDARSSQAQATLGSFKSAIGIAYAKARGVWPTLATLNTLFADGNIPTPIISSNVAKDINAVAAWATPGPTADVGGWMYNVANGTIQLNSTAIDPSSTKAWSTF